MLIGPKKGCVAVIVHGTFSKGTKRFSRTKMLLVALYRTKKITDLKYRVNALKSDLCGLLWLCKSVCGLLRILLTVDY